MSDITSFAIGDDFSDGLSRADAEKRLRKMLRFALDKFCAATPDKHLQYVVPINLLDTEDGKLLIRTRVRLVAQEGE